jgi:hypothetical protein
MLADSKLDSPAAAKVLDSALASDEAAPAAVRARALILRADLAYRMDEPDRARAWLAEARGIALSSTERAGIADDLGRADEVEGLLANG